ncbi:MAG: DNA translocase FtsK 4TM domain-containing protein [Bacteroidales bacterium]|nr:DNA translocase FtsK 4TM domain-containing protein [Bacteroidales bacterium]
MYVTTRNQSVKHAKKSKKSNNSSSKGGGSSSKKHLTKEQWHKIFGILLLLFSLVAFVSILSFWFTHAADQEYVQPGSDTQPGNWCRGLGAYLAHFCCDATFGLFAIGIPFLTFLYGVRLTFEKTLLPLFRTTVTTVLTMVWLSMFLAFFFVKKGEVDINSFPSGFFGNSITGLLVDGTGKIATFFILLALLLLILFLCYNISPSVFVKAGSKVKDKWVESRKNRNDSDDDDDYDEDDAEIVAGGKKKKKGSQQRETEDLPGQYIEELGGLSKEYGNNTIDLGGSETANQKPEAPVTEVPFDIVNGDSSNDTPQEENVNAEMAVEPDTPEPAPLALPEPALPLEDYDPRLDLSHYQFPTTDLLLDYQPTVINEAAKMQELREKKERIEKTLKSFGIEIKKIFATIGPTVTLYEIVPAEGVRISKIKNLEDDIALSLAALGIRIIAPIPGKGTIGIEVPNANPQIVAMKDILDSDKFQNNKYDLPIGLGKTISNEPFVADLAKMPHLLMAGATGQGKSVGLNAIIASLLYKKHPSELKFVLIDPKKVEFTLYSIIERHYLAMLPGADNPIITDVKKVIYTLNSLCAEMDARYDLLQLAQVRNIKEYNTKFCQRKLSPTNGHRYLPYIVLVIDEFGDLIMTAGREVETPIARLAQLARAIGIHLIIATQRPSVNIITGVIKANFPSRIAFRVTSIVDSRTILDGSGANQLIGKGDMLLSTGSDLVRLQCAFIDTPEVEALTRFIADQQGYPEPFLLPEYVEETTGRGDDEPVNPNEIDSCFMDAATLIVETQMGSTSLLQRKMKLGYARAGRIMDQLEEFKIVGPAVGSKVREVKVKTAEELRMIFQSMGLI